MLELRAGRIDALAAGPFGIPGPADSFASQKAKFAQAGLSQTEMITAVYVILLLLSQISDSDDYTARADIRLEVCMV